MQKCQKETEQERKIRKRKDHLVYLSLLLLPLHIMGFSASTRPVLYSLFHLFLSFLSFGSCRTHADTTNCDNFAHSFLFLCCSASCCSSYCNLGLGWKSSSLFVQLGFFSNASIKPRKVSSFKFPRACSSSPSSGISPCC